MGGVRNAVLECQRETAKQAGPLVRVTHRARDDGACGIGHNGVCGIGAAANPAVIPGVAQRRPGIQTAVPKLPDDIAVEITPVRVDLFNQSDLPGTPPFLDLLFAGNGQRYHFVCLSPNQPGQSVLAREDRSDPTSVFIDTPREIVRNASVERSISTIGHNVDPSGQSSASLSGGSRVCGAALRAAPRAG